MSSCCIKVCIHVCRKYFWLLNAINILLFEYLNIYFWHRKCSDFQFLEMLYREVGVSKQFCLLLDQTNFHVNRRPLKFKKNIYGRPEVSLFSGRWCVIKLVSFFFMDLVCCSLSYLIKFIFFFQFFVIFLIAYVKR